MKPPITVLLVEDDKDDQFFFVEAVNEIENARLYAVANNGKEALDLLQNSEALPHLIFTDINMPVMSGIDYLKEIKQNPRTKDIPVVVLLSDLGKTEQVCQLGAKAFIQKPSDSNTLHKQIKGLVNFYFEDAEQTADANLQAKFMGCW